jgi:hypothetical protein
VKGKTLEIAAVLDAKGWNVVTVDPDASHLPVVGKRGLCGVVSVGDLLRHGLEPAIDAKDEIHPGAGLGGDRQEAALTGSVR